MAYIDRDPDNEHKVVAHTEFVERELIKQVPGFTWDAGRKLWVGPLSWGTCQVMRGVFGAKLTVGEALTAWAWEEKRRRVDPCMWLREQVDGESNDPRLRPFQRPGVQFMAIGRRVLLADDMGLGKTIQTISAVRTLEAWGEDVWPVLCIVPNSTKIDWERHWHDWYGPGLEVFVIRSKDKKKVLKLAGESIKEGRRTVVVMNWEAVRLHSRLAPYGSIRLKRCIEHGGTEERISRCEVHHKELNDFGFRTVIVDEAHKMKDPQSKQTRAVWAVQHAAEFRFSLTGTPLANHPGDVWAIMHGIAPDDYPTKVKYTDRYCLMAWSAFGGMDIVGVRPDTRDEYFRILDPRMRRMPKELVLSNLPPKTRMRRLAEMGTKQKKAYDEVAKGMVTRLDDGRLVVTTNSLTQQLRLLQFSSSYAEVDDEGHVRLSEPSSKIDTLMEVLDELGDKPVVVAAESRQLIELACARLDKRKITWRSITGGQTESQRDQAKTDFMEGRARVMLFTIKAGGVGLTLTIADTIVFLQRSWSMLENRQAEDRIHRIGSERHENVTIIDLVAPGTVEESQILSLYEKSERLEEIVRDRARFQAEAERGNPDAIRKLVAIEAEEALILNSDLTGQELLPAPQEVFA